MLFYKFYEYVGNPQPDVYAMADVAGCAVKELECEGAQGMAMLGEGLKNPGKVARANRYKSGACCAGVYLEVTLRDLSAEKLIIPPVGP